MAIINRPVFFPASENIRRYLPGFIVMGSQTSPSINTIWLLPIFIKKYAINPTFCIDVSGYGVTAGTPQVVVGIYKGVDIFNSAELLFSTTFNLTSSGVKKNPSTLKLNSGWYTLATLVTVNPTSGTISYRSASQNLNLTIFKTKPNDSFYSGLFGSYTIAASSLPTNLRGQNIVRSTSASLIAALEF